MLPCGRYYYEPEGGYVGNPWVKFSYQYIYLYLAWFVHHLDLVDQYLYRFYSEFSYQKSGLYRGHLKIISRENLKFRGDIYAKTPNK